MSTEPNNSTNPKSCSSCDHDHEDSSLPQGLLVISSGILTAFGLLFHWTHSGPAWLPTALFGLAILAGGALVLPPAWRALQKRRLDINVLMAVAVTGAWIIGEYAEAASVVFLFAFSEWRTTLCSAQLRS